MPTAAEVEQTWKTPPPEYGPEPYYGLNGAVDETVIRRDLDTMKSLGFQAVTVQAGYGMPFAYLSTEYFAFFRTFVEEAKKRNMRVWIVDDAGYPSGFAGGKFTELKPEMRMQALVAAQRIPANSGRTRQSSRRARHSRRDRINADNGETAIDPGFGEHNQLDRPCRPLDRRSRRAPVQDLAHAPTPIQNESRTAPSRSRTISIPQPQRIPRLHARTVQKSRGRRVRQDDHGLSRRRARLLHQRTALDAQVFRSLPADQGLRHSALPGSVLCNREARS